MYLQYKVGLFLLIIILAFTSALKSIRRDKYGMLRPPPVKNSNKFLAITDEWFTQKLDHFTPTDERTFQQLYFSSDKYFNKSGPVFLWIGAEGAASKSWMYSGAWINYAETYGAFCFYLNIGITAGLNQQGYDISVDSLKYLSSEQALADLAYFIEGMNEKYNFTTSTKWIVFGGSYAGNLAAWARLKYPHLVHGAVSSSGPLLAELDFKEYFYVVTDSLATYGENCVNAISKAVKQIHTMLKKSSGRNKLYKKFQLCNRLKINKQKDIANFLEGLADTYAGVVQYNDYSSEININTLCGIMTNKSIGSVFERFVEVNNLVSSQEDCLDFSYSNLIKSLMNTSWEAADGGRQWTYQTCSEFGYYQTSNKNKDLFGNSFRVDFFINLCTDVFGKQFNKTTLNESVQRSNIIYGGLNIDVSKVVFVHGSIDPWHALGITVSNSTSAPAIYIEGTSHCANMYESSSTDPSGLVAARKQISSLIGQWLQE